ncbi:hypothetical protein [Flavobacterium acetivorans]|uniref:hypothetical protein n=1 Tax=Flavobacterium acetivorans TaxID=2893883 RepID=UPI001E32D804|nr:hypothetical protein [Flavobacterium sp. F-29]UFH36337.1 hypothetical protein LNP19_04655 [Flavobacterium sp. F-29]
MEIAAKIITFILLLSLVVSPILIINRLFKLNLNNKFIIYLISGIIITAFLTLTIGWWSTFSNKILLSHYGYNFNAMNDVERFENVGLENLDRVKQLEINILGIGWPLKAYTVYTIYSPYLIIVYLATCYYKKTKNSFCIRINMKKLLLIIICNLSNIVTGQNLPQLKLQDPIGKELDLPGIILNKDEICVILTTNQGFTAYDEKTYYTFKKNGKIEAYEEMAPKSNLKYLDLKKSGEKIILDTATQKYFLDCLNSKVTLDFLNYSQSDFTIENNEPVTTLLKSHPKKYEITFLQNNNSKSYFFYEPRQQFRDTNSRINKIILEKFIKLLELWQMLKT